jgi:hypothetical protein
VYAAISRIFGARQKTNQERDLPPYSDKEKNRAGILGHLWGPLTTPRVQDVGSLLAAFVFDDPTSEVDS